MEWKKGYDRWQIFWGNVGSLILIFAGGYLMTHQPSGIGGSAYGAGLWATILGVGMAISSTVLELRINILRHLEEEDDE